MILTPTLRNFLESYKSKISDQEFKQLQWDVDAALDLFTADLARSAPGAERGRRVHFLIEQEIKKNENIQVTCQKGCGFCCHFEVEITSDDAEVLKEAVLKGIDLDWERMEQLSKRERQGVEWKQGVVPANRCLFLGSDNTCRIYESRPASCRRLSVISPPSECETLGGNPIPRLIPMVEIILSAALNFPDAQLGSFAHMLKNALLDKEQDKPETSISL